MTLPLKDARVGEIDALEVYVYGPTVLTSIIGGFFGYRKGKTFGWTVAGGLLGALAGGAATAGVLKAMKT